MKKWIIGIVAGGLALAVACLIHVHGDAAPRGEGSFRAAKKVYSELESLRSHLPALQLRKGYYKFSFNDGGWYVATGIDTHTERDGGTLGILTSDGEVAVFFTHVCGPGTAALELLPGDNPAEMLEKLRAISTEWKPTP